MAVSDYSTTPADNTAISGLPVSDSTVANQLDNIIRQLMADIKTADALNLKTASLGVTAQAYDADLTAIAALTSAANKLPYATGSGAWALTDFTAAGRALVDDASASAQRTTLGLGTAAVAALIDDDTMATASAANVASAESVKAYADSGAAGTSVGVNTTTGASTVGPFALPAGVRKFWMTFTKTSLDGTGNILVQLSTGASFVTTGYDSRSLAGSSGNSVSTAGMIISVGAASNYFDGTIEFVLHTGNTWRATHTGSNQDSGNGMTFGSGTVDLGGAVDQVQLATTAGTFDAVSVNVHY